MLTQIVKHEWRNLRADRTLWAVAALLAVTIGFGIRNGSEWVRFQNDTLKAVAAEERERLAAVNSGIIDAQAGRTKPTSFTDPRSPSVVGRTLGARYASMPPAPLAALAIGQSDLYPYYFKVSTSTRQTFLNNDEIEHPVHLMSGRFDLAFVILYLYPLIILALSYNLLSAEKEAGTLAMTLSQPVGLPKLVLGKIALRFVFILLPGGVLSLAGAIGGGTNIAADGGGSRLLLWFGVVALYGAFWYALAAAVNAFGRGSSSNAIALAAFWLAFVLVIPSLLNVGVKYVHPVPSRVELIQAMREASREAAAQGSRLLASYYEDHPELAGDRTDAADFAALALANQEQVEKRIRPVLDRFDQQLDLQQRLVDRYRFLSPAVVAQAALFDIAGTSEHRYKHFLGLADRFHRDWRAHFYRQIVRNASLAPQDVDRFPEFHFEEEPWRAVAGRSEVGLVVLLFAVMVVGAVAAWLLRRYPVAA